MQWVETLTQVEATTGAALAAANCGEPWLLAVRTRSRARRTGAAALALVSAAFALESLSFVAAPLFEGSMALEAGAALAVRSVSLLATAALSVLLLRSRGARP